MDEVYLPYAYLLDETGAHSVSLKPEVLAAYARLELRPWLLSEAEALLQELFHAQRLAVDFVSVFGRVTDYLSDDPTVVENVYEVSDPEIMAQWMTEMERQFSRERGLDVWRFALGSDAQGGIVGFYCPLIPCNDLMGYIFLFEGWHQEGNGYRGFAELGYIDFLVRKGFLAL